ncbi:MAG TPA: hypothetical protein VGL72_28050 [Bryobacteraceae bacterium]
MKQEADQDQPDSEDFHAPATTVTRQGEAGFQPDLEGVSAVLGDQAGDVTGDGVADGAIESVWMLSSPS